MTKRAALYLRVSTSRQAESDLSLPDQQRQCTAYCELKGWTVAVIFSDGGRTGTDGDRPGLQRLMDMAARPDRPFDVVVVHSLSRFFRDQVELELSLRRLRRADVELISITQEFSDDPTGDLVRRIISLFDEFQSRENAKHTLRAMEENARQGFWNGSQPPLGYKVVAAETRGTKEKKRLAIDEAQAVTVRLIFDLYLNGDGQSGPLGVKAITSWLNQRGFHTRNGGRFAIKAVHDILRRTTYMGLHCFNRVEAKTGQRKPDDKLVPVPVPALIDAAAFARVQERLAAHNPKRTPPRVVNGPCLLTGIAVCATCGGGMTLRTGKSGRYRYYTCATKARQGDTACPGRSVPMDLLDSVVLGALSDQLLQPDRLAVLLDELAQDTIRNQAKEREALAVLERTVTTIDQKARRLLQSIEAGVIDPRDDTVRTRMAELKEERRLAQEAVVAAATRLGTGPVVVTPAKVAAFSALLRDKLATGPVAFRKTYLSLFVGRVEVDDALVRVLGSTRRLSAVVASDGGDALRSVPSFVRKWRPHGDSNPGYRRERAVS